MIIPADKPADKGRVTVAMDYSDYTNKAKELINDTNTYQPLDTKPSKSTVNRITKNLQPSGTRIDLANRFMIKSGPMTQQSLNSMDFQKSIKRIALFDQLFPFLDHPPTSYQNTSLISL